MFSHLWAWCRQRNFAGHDPFDALNSGLFRAMPFSNTRIARLGWTQLVKRSPLNLRNLTNVPTQQNSKGIALFALAALARYRAAPGARTETEAHALLEALWNMRLDTGSGTSWGYNFDWQSRYFFAPRGTPTVVPTAFAARALMDAFETFKVEQYLKQARSVCDFILRDLTRSVETDSELCFSYTPQAPTRIFNASLLAAETLQTVGALTAEEELLEAALKATRYVVNRQRSDGAWTYGAEEDQYWVDNFHTAFVLDSLARINRCLSVHVPGEFVAALDRGYDYWRKSFFLADGWPKYYDDALFPADVHSAAAAVVTLCDLKAMTASAEISTGALPLAETIAAWSQKHLRDERGFFYYQQRRFFTARTPFMRWGQAWMSYALARLLEERGVAV